MKSLHKYNLIYLCENDLSQPLGGTLHVQETLTALSRITENTILIAPIYSKEPAITVPDNIEINWIKCPNTSIIKWIYFYVFSLFSILKRRTHTSVLYIREMPFNILLPLIARITSLPFFIEVNSILASEVREAGRGMIEYNLTKAFQRIIYHLSSGIVAVSRIIADNLKTQFHIKTGKVRTIYNGVSFSKKVTKPINLGSIFNIKSPFCIGFIGSCYPIHDLGLLIEISPALLKKYSDIRFVIAGDGIMLKQWKKRVNELNMAQYFYFPGYINFDRVQAYIKQFNICLAINKKRRNGPGMKIFEYLYYDKPVIASYVPESYELFKNQSNVVWVKPENTKDLYYAISKIYKNYEFYSGMKSHSYIKSNYSWDNTGRNILNFIKKRLYAASPE